MGYSDQTGRSSEADAFFARFVDAAPEVIAAVVAERGGDLDAIIDEQRAYGYWDRKMAERATRRTRRQAADAARRARQIAEATRYSHPDETARRPTPEAAQFLPVARVVRLTEQERRDTDRWWKTLDVQQHRNGLTIRIRSEARKGATRQSRLATRARIAAERWRAEQRAFERAQWRAVLARQQERRRKRISNQWAAISEQRALEIALDALEKTTPPQGRT